MLARALGGRKLTLAGAYVIVDVDVDVDGFFR
jgi:hypothetical protein